MRGIDRSVIMADSAGLVSLARDLHQWGQHKVAEALFQQAATHLEQILGSDDPTLANILDAYTDFLVSLRREAEAASLRERSNQIRGRARPASI
jgi:hypothetical protein